MRAGEELVVALHPTEAPVEVAVPGDGAATACPSPGMRWPGGMFTTCLGAGEDGRIVVPGTGDPSYHVAFVVRAGADGPFDVRITYSAADAFMVVTLPATVAAGGTVTFEPRTGTAGAEAFILPGYAAVPGVRAVIEQDGRPLTRRSPCDFGSEIECVGA